MIEDMEGRENFPTGNTTMIFLNDNELFQNINLKKFSCKPLWSTHKEDQFSFF